MKMVKKYDKSTIHHKMKVIIEEMVEKELPLKDALREFEKIYISTASEKYNGKKVRMAKALGIHRNTLCNRIKALKI